MIRKKYVLISQGIKIFETYNKQEAIDIMEASNKEWRKYMEYSGEYVDNEVIMVEEYESI